jgi:hypothetical protein
LFELAQTFHLLENMFEKILATHDVEMAFDLGIFLGEAINLFLV